MKKNKLFLLVAMFAVAFLVLVACGNGDDNGGTAEAPAATEAPPADDNGDDNGDEEPPANGLAGDITFSWWGDDPRHNATNEIIDLFVSENPGVTITPFYAPWSGFQDVFAGDLMANSEADLMQINFNWLQLYSPFGTTFMDLEDPIITEHLDLSNWSTADIDIVRTNGVVQAVPTGMTARVPFMRRDIYEAAGLNIEDINTWEDLKAAGNTIQEELGEDVWAFGKLGNASTAYFMFSWLEQYTGRQFVDDDNQFSYTLEELTAAFQFIQDLMDNGVLAYGQFDSAAFNSTNENWINGHFGAVFEWDSSINNWINNLDGGEDLIAVRDHFTMDGAQLSGVMTRPSMGFAISNNSDYPEVAAAFLNFMLTDPRAVAILGTDRGVPANQVGLAHFEDLVAAGEIGGAAIDANNVHANAVRTTMSPVFEFPTVRAIYENQLEALIYGFTTVEEAAQFVYDNIQAEIDAELN